MPKNLQLRLGPSPHRKPNLDRALPTWAYKQLRTGVKLPKRDDHTCLRSGAVKTVCEVCGSRQNAADEGRARVYCALRSVAMSAHVRGWRYHEWRDHLADPNVTLVRDQFSMRMNDLLRGIKRERDRVDVEKGLQQIWIDADLYLSDEQQKQDDHDALAEMAMTCSDQIAEGRVNPNLKPNDILVLDWILEQIVHRGYNHPVCPIREIMAATGLTFQNVRTVLRRLVSLEVIEQLSAGMSYKQAAQKKQKATASIYTVHFAMATDMNAVPSIPPADTTAPERQVPADVVMFPTTSRSPDRQVTEPSAATGTEGRIIPFHRRE